jgi:hypothetical protein
MACAFYEDLSDLTLFAASPSSVELLGCATLCPQLRMRHPYDVANGVPGVSPVWTGNREAPGLPLQPSTCKAGWRKPKPSLRSCAGPTCSSCQRTTSRCTPGWPGPCTARRRAPGRMSRKAEQSGTSHAQGSYRSSQGCLRGGPRGANFELYISMRAPISHHGAPGEEPFLRCEFRITGRVPSQWRTPLRCETRITGQERQ